MTNHDFDFVAGRWTSTQRRLSSVLTGSDDWYEFSATLDAQVLLDGNATFDVLRAPEQGIEGITLRLYDGEQKIWRIWWATARGTLDVPVEGRFVDGVGTFECDDTWQGRPIRVRYQWLDTESPAPRWEQAFSEDGGTTWEVNWVATFRRAA
ncbi:hypothetical protein [Xylanimonas sp. McL0601]|uniref:hypothetical protein n=1 Tax=Xylanimonas sp. McL0601 TaxID=3414739 RepID=UPI003CFA62A5